MKMRSSCRQSPFCMAGPPIMCLRCTCRAKAENKVSSTGVSGEEARYGALERSSGSPAQPSPATAQPDRRNQSMITAHSRHST